VSRSLTTNRREQSACSSKAGRYLAEIQLISGPWAYAHHEEVMISYLKLTKNSLLGRGYAAHDAFDLNSVGISQPDNLPDHRLRAGSWRQRCANLALPGARRSSIAVDVECGNHSPAMLAPARLPARRRTARPRSR
jgi:hypothetical protein